MALQLRLLSRQLRSAQASSLSAASGALGANVTSGRQTTASPLAVRLVGASPPCTLRSHSLAPHARDMPLLCYLSDPLGFLPQAACPSRCCMFLAVNQVPAPAADSVLRDSSTLGLLNHSYRTHYSIRVSGREDEDVREMFHRAVRGGAMQRARVSIPPSANLISALGDESMPV
jgi:hypothetical protein